MKFRVVAASVVVCLGAVLLLPNVLSAPAVASDTDDVIADSQFADCINTNYLGRPSDTPISADDLSELMEVDCSAYAVTDLTGAEHLTIVTSLKINGGGGVIVDLFPLENLVTLTSLTITDAGLTDISHLTALVNLYMIDVSRNRIDTVAPIGTMHSLETVILRDNDLTVLSRVADLSSLIYLDVSGNHITDFSALDKRPATFPPLQIVAAGQTVEIYAKDDEPVAVPQITLPVGDGVADPDDSSYRPVLVGPVAPVGTDTVWVRQADSDGIPGTTEAIIDYSTTPISVTYPAEASYIWTGDLSSSLPNYPALKVEFTSLSGSFTVTTPVPLSPKKSEVSLGSVWGERTDGIAGAKTGGAARIADGVDAHILYIHVRDINGDPVPGLDPKLIRVVDPGVDVGQVISDADVPGLYSVALVSTVPGSTEAWVYLDVNGDGIFSETEKINSVAFVDNYIWVQAGSSSVVQLEIQIFVGVGFFPGELVAIELSIGGERVVIGFVSADDAGRIEFRHALPEDAKPGTYDVIFAGIRSGTHTSSFEVSSLDGAGTETGRPQVSQSPTAAGDPDSGTSGDASGESAPTVRTGGSTNLSASTGVLMALAVGCLVLGLALLAIGKTTSQRRQSGDSRVA